MAISNSITQTGVTTGTLGSAAGRTIFTNGVLPGFIASLMFTYSATATAGNRQPEIQIKDSSSNIVWRNICSTNVTASQGGQFACASGIATSNLPAVIFTISLALPAYLPPSGTITVFDVANIDVNDTISAGQIVIQY